VCGDFSKNIRYLIHNTNNEPQVVSHTPPQYLAAFFFIVMHQGPYNKRSLNATTKSALPFLSMLSFICIKSSRYSIVLPKTSENIRYKTKREK
jgi:hypothetical protein